MRRTLIAAGSFALLLGTATNAAAHERADDDGGRDHRVVVEGLDNPRQLAWAGDTLLVAEGGDGGQCAPATTPEPAPQPAPAPEPAPAPTGSGTDGTTTTGSDDGTPDQGSGDATPTPGTDDGTPDQGSGDATPTPGTDDGTPDQGSGDATPTPGTDDGTATPDPGTGTTTAAAAEVCVGDSGAITAVHGLEDGREVRTERVVEGLDSTRLPDGSSIGPGGVAATGVPGVLLIATGEPTPDALRTDATALQERLLVSTGGTVRSWVDFGDLEEAQNPDGAQLDSNPNQVLVVDPTPDGPPRVDEYVLVADAGANTVWKVTPDFADLGDEELPAVTVTVFATFPTTPPPAGGADDGVIEFVPTSLAQDERGHVYVGGAGSLVAGGASVIEFEDRGAEQAAVVDRWDGFTGINGLAVDRDGEHLYVSQIGGPPEGTGTGAGSVVRVETDDDEYRAVEVPAPSGLAVDRDGDVYVSAYSTSPAAGRQDDPATTDAEAGTPGGQLWELRFRGGDEARLPVTTPAANLPQPAVLAPTVPDPTVPQPTVPDPTVPDPTVPEPTVPDPTVPDPTVPEPTVPDPTVPDPTVPLDDDGTPDQGSGDVAVTP
ncbi:ScyD/ScyE family protein [Geodermatophilus sp. SYSU D00815]